jgi:hypothetical protein
MNEDEYNELMEDREKEEETFSNPVELDVGTYPQLMTCRHM